MKILYSFAIFFLVLFGTFFVHALSLHPDTTVPQTLKNSDQPSNLSTNHSRGKIDKDDPSDG